jgi:hypothetical protein
LATVGIISTFAGSPVGNGSPANNLSIPAPIGLAEDPAGKLYIASNYYYAVYQVGTGGLISVTAGIGFAGTGPDGGLAVNTPFPALGALTTDSLGNFYIGTANGGGRIQKVSAATNIVSTVAGNGVAPYAPDGSLATSGGFSQSPKMCVGPGDQLYYIDLSNNVVRRVDLASGVVSTVAGTYASSGYAGDGGPASSAKLNNPVGVAADAAGNLYIADGLNYRIRKVNAVTHNITTVAGTGAFSSTGDGGQANAAGFSALKGLAVDPTGNIYILDNQRVRRVDAVSGIITAFAGGGGSNPGDGGAATLAALGTLQAIVADGAGNVYFSDSTGNRVRKVAGGIITTYAGNGKVQYSGDGGPAVQALIYGPRGVAADSQGNVYIADYNNAVVRKVDAGGKISTYAGGGAVLGDGGPATSAKLKGPQSLAVDSLDGLFIADAQDERVRRVDAVTHNITTVAGSGSATYSGDNGPAILAGLKQPQGIYVDKNGDLFIADSLNYTVRKVHAGIITTFAGNNVVGISGGSPWPFGISATACNIYPLGVTGDSAGNIYFSNLGNGAGGGSLVHKVDTNGILTRYAGYYGTPIGATGPPGPDWGEGAVATSASPPVYIAQPWGLFMDSGNNLFISDYFGNEVRRVDGNTKVITTVAGAHSGANPNGDGGPATAAELYSPMGVCVGSNMHLYIADYAENAIREVDLPTFSPTYSISPTFTVSPVVTATPTRTVTQTRTVTPTRTVTATISPTRTQTIVPSPFPSRTFTATLSATPSLSPSFSATASETPLLSPTETPTGAAATASSSPSASRTSTSSPTPSSTSTASFSPSASRTGTSTPTASPTDTSTSSPSASRTATSTATQSPISSASSSPTASRTTTATATPSFSSTGSPSPSASRTGSATSTASPSFSPTRTDTLTPSPSPVVTATSSPTQGASPTQISTPVAAPPPAELVVFESVPVPQPQGGPRIHLAVRLQGQAQEAELRLFSVGMTEVARLRASGDYSSGWNQLSFENPGLAGGLYYYRLKVSGPSGDSREPKAGRLYLLP